MNVIPSLGSWPPGTLELPPKASDLTRAQRHALVNSPNVAVAINGECFNIPRDVLLSFLSVARMSHAEIRQNLQLDLQINISMPSIKLALNWISEACNGTEDELPWFMLSHDPINMILAAAALGLDFELLRIRPAIEALFDFMTIPNVVELMWQAGQANVTFLRNVLLHKFDGIIRTEQQEQEQMPGLQVQTQTLEAVWAFLNIFGVLHLSRDAHDVKAHCLRDALLNRFSKPLYLSTQTPEIKLRALGLAGELGLGIAEIALEQNLLQNSGIQTLELMLQGAGEKSLGRLFWQMLKVTAMKLKEKERKGVHRSVEMRSASPRLQDLLHGALRKL